MLVLTRKVGEKILIAENIVIEVVQIQEGRVRIGIDAPRNITVMREEIADREMTEPGDEV